jgi:hypothetical protein
LVSFNIRVRVRDKINTIGIEKSSGNWRKGKLFELGLELGLGCNREELNLLFAVFYSIILSLIFRSLFVRVRVRMKS